MEGCRGSSIDDESRVVYDAFNQSTSNFIAYANQGFGDDDQLR
jgi:hypothetical protein